MKTSLILIPLVKASAILGFLLIVLFNFGILGVFPIVLVFLIFSQLQESINSKDGRQVGNCLCN